MAGRGDNNKHGSAGRGASNQSNQGAKDKSAEISENIRKVQENDKKTEKETRDRKNSRKP